MGTMQLKLFGAWPHVASLVALGSTTEMAPLMTGAIMAGRTCQAYAAQRGAMKIDEEIDSLPDPDAEPRSACAGGQGARESRRAKALVLQAVCDQMY